MQKTESDINSSQGRDQSNIGQSNINFTESVLDVIL